MAEVGSALDYAHARGLVHRDIKPANILFTPEGVAKVTDFGIVRAADGTRITRTGVLLGTPEYMSPEQAEGEEVDRRTDLYALGVVLYQMVTGEVPFGGTTPHVVMHGVIYEPPRPPEEVVPGLPRALSGVLLKALAKVPGERFQSGGALAEAFAGARQGRTVVVPRSARVAGSPPAATAAERLLQPVHLWPGHPAGGMGCGRCRGGGAVGGGLDRSRGRLECCRGDGHGPGRDRSGGGAWTAPRPVRRGNARDRAAAVTDTCPGG